MGSARRHVPPGRAIPAPEPPNSWDKHIVEGPHRHKIAEMLDELGEIAEVDWTYRHLVSSRNGLSRRDALFVELRKLQVTTGRMQRAYAIEGQPLITHVGIKAILGKAGVPVGSGPKRPSTLNEEEEDD